MFKLFKKHKFKLFLTIIGIPAVAAIAFTLILTGEMAELANWSHPDANLAFGALPKGVSVDFRQNSEIGVTREDYRFIYEVNGSKTRLFDISLTESLTTEIEEGYEVFETEDLEFNGSATAIPITEATLFAETEIVDVYAVKADSDLFTAYNQQLLFPVEEGSIDVFYSEEKFSDLNGQVYSDQYLELVKEILINMYLY